MRKRVNVKEPLELELVFKDKSLVLVFNTRALMNIASSQEDLMKFLNNINFAEVCATIVWASADPCIDMEEARKITSNLDKDTIMEIVTSFNESVGTYDSDVREVKKELEKKYMAQFLNNMK